MSVGLLRPKDSNMEEPAYKATNSRDLNGITVKMQG
jgi:hypothetical protein